MIIETERLILRPWELTDAEALYRYARDPEVGPIAGWPPHISVGYSREIIRLTLSSPETYAVVPRDAGGPVGSIGLMPGQRSNIPIGDDEAEIGYWIGVPYWGQGLIPEAVEALCRRGFEDLDFKALWCGHFRGNEKSHRVWEKCGFTYHHTEENIFWPMMGDIRTEIIARLGRDEWEARQNG